MSDLAGRKVFKVFNQDFVVDDRYVVTKELGQGAYGIVWYVHFSLSRAAIGLTVRFPSGILISNVLHRALGSVLC